MSEFNQIHTKYTFYNLFDMYENNFSFKQNFDENLLMYKNLQHSLNLGQMLQYLSKFNMQPIK